MHIAEELKIQLSQAKEGVVQFAGMKVQRMETLDGIKLFLDNSESTKQTKCCGNVVASAGVGNGTPPSTLL